MIYQNERNLTCVTMLEIKMPFTSSFDMTHLHILPVRLLEGAPCNLMVHKITSHQSH